MELVEDVTIPAHHEIITTGKPLQSTAGAEVCAAFEPRQHDGAGFLVARCLVMVTDVVPLRFVNLSNNSIQLLAGYIVGRLYPVTTQPNEDCPSTSTMACRMVKVWPEEQPAAADDAAINMIEEVKDLPQHLRELYQESIKEIPSGAVRQKLASILKRRHLAFARHHLDAGHFSAIQHEIDTACAAPVRERVRRTPRGFEEEEEKCLKEQLAAGVIRPSSSAWAAPTVLVCKGDGSVRWCIDYRSLNCRTLKDAYPLPRMDMCFDSLGSVQYFSTLDLQSGYWQIQVAKEDVPKTAFITKYGLYEYLKMPFGLCNAPSTFQRCMELVFRGLQWKTLLIYLDDIIILGSSMDENLERLDEALARLEDAHLKLKPSKCKLLQTEVLFLGHIVSAQGMKPNPRLVEAVKDWDVPRNRKDVQRFLGLCNYYRRFVPHFSNLANPLTHLTSKNVDFQWTTETQQSFDALKAALCAAPLLAYPLPEGDYILDTDASNVAIGGILSQVQDGEERVIAYSSKKLDKQQRRYCVTRRELLAVVAFLREFKNYLLGVQFQIRTDHSSLTWLLNFREPQGQLARWIEYIFQFKFSISHRPGKKHGNADALSRPPDSSASCDKYESGMPLESLPCGGCSYCKRRQEEWEDFKTDVDDVVPISQVCRQVTTRSRAKSTQATSTAASEDGGQGLSAATASWIDGYTTQQLSDLQRQDPVLLPVHEWVDAGFRPTRDESASLGAATRSYWINYDNLERIESVLYLRWADPNKKYPTQRRLLVPQSLQHKVLACCHDALFAGHLGVQKTVDEVKRRFHWPGLRRDVKIHIRNCKTCGANKMPYKKFRAALSNFRVGEPMDRLGINFMGPLPQTKQGNKYLLVIVDYFTRWAEAFTLPDQQAETLAATFVREFVCRYGAPLEVHSDQGMNFESALFQEICQLFGICKTRSSPYHPSSNGLVERFNRTLASLIRSYLEMRVTDWDEHIPYLTSAYRATVHPSTGFTPNFLMFGRETSGPVDLPFPVPKEGQSPSVPEYVVSMQERLVECYNLARELLRAAAERQKRDHDTRVSQNKFQPGDLVWKRYHVRKKLERPWVGPYVIRKVLSDCLYLVSDKKSTYALHHDLLKPYTSTHVPRWAQQLRATC